MQFITVKLFYFENRQIFILKMANIQRGLQEKCQVLAIRPQNGPTVNIVLWFDTVSCSVTKFGKLKLAFDISGVHIYLLINHLKSVGSAGTCTDAKIFSRSSHSFAW